MERKEGICSLLIQCVTWNGRSRELDSSQHNLQKKKKKKDEQFPFCIWLLGKGQSLGEKNTFIFP